MHSDELLEWYRPSRRVLKAEAFERTGQNTRYHGHTDSRDQPSSVQLEARDFGLRHGQNLEDVREAGTCAGHISSKTTHVIECVDLAISLTKRELAATNQGRLYGYQCC